MGWGIESTTQWWGDSKGIGIGLTMYKKGSYGYGGAILRMGLVSPRCYGSTADSQLGDY